MMNIVVLENDEKMLRQTFSLLESVVPDASVYGTVSKTELLTHLMEHKADICFVPCVIEKKQELFSFAKKLKVKFPRLNLIFVADGGELRGMAMDLKASGYLVRPLNAEQIRFEFDNLRYAV